MTSPTFPLNPAVVQDGAVTLDMFVQEPTRISAYIADNVAANLVAQHLFSTEGASGGAILFDQVTEVNNGVSGDPGVIAPGAEFPHIGSAETEPVVKSVKKTGGKYEVTREAMKRNRPEVLQRHAVRVANRMARDIDARAFKTITEDLAEVDGALTFESKGWKTAQAVAENAKTPTTGSNQVFAELTQAALLSEEKDLGYNMDTFVVSPADYAGLRILLGAEGFSTVFNDLGLTVLKSNALTDGEALLLQRGMVGVMGVEDPISTDTDYVKARQVQEFYTWATMAFGVTDPFSVVKITNLDK